MIKTVCIIGAAVAASVMLAGPALAQSLLAVPEDGALRLWDTRSSPPRVRSEGLPTGVPGACYVLDAADTRVIDPDMTACMDHLLRDAEVVTGGADPYDIVGIVRAQPGPLGETSTGFMVTNVTGVAYCGEREDCDQIYILGVSQTALLNPLAAAVRSGQQVRLRGSGVWNLESIDLIVDRIDTRQ